MLEHVRPYDVDYGYSPAPAAPARLENFQVFKKIPYTYGNYPASYEGYDHDVDPNVYHTLVSAYEYHRDDWRNKPVVEWTADDTTRWVYDVVHNMGTLDTSFPFYNFAVTGHELRDMNCETIVHKADPYNSDPYLMKIGETIFEKLQDKLQQDDYQTSVVRFPDSIQYQQQQCTLVDLDKFNRRDKSHEVLGYVPNDIRLMTYNNDSSDDTDVLRSTCSASPTGSYHSEVSKSEEDKHKIAKRRPGRPPGKKVCKRQRNLSVPEFLKNLILDPRYCPEIIRWECYPEKKFRFIKPDEVAKLWGQLKDNKTMTFEKFSRAMRYHYKQEVLESVPSIRLVYKFGRKSPNIETDNPNFTSKP